MCKKIITKRGEIYVNFKPLDVVEVINVGASYDLFVSAFRFFKIDMKSAQNSYNDGQILNTNVNLKTNWLIVDCGIHPLNSKVLYHIKNKYNEHLVIEERGIKIKKKQNGAWLEIKEIP